MNTTISRFFIRNAASTLVIFSTLIIFAFFYSPILFHPGEYLFNNTGDAIKNYYSLEWHVHNDSSMVNYTGTNYPFGEHQAYTDGNPLLSNALKLLPYLNNYSIPILNLSFLFSFLLCALLLYKILKEFKVMDLYAIIASIGITFLCPQVFRLSGHFSLSYNFCLPLIIYLLLKLETTASKKKYTFLIAISILCFFFIHPYLGLISSSLILLYWILKSVGDFKTSKLILTHIILQVVVPLGTYFLYTKLTDTHSDRIVKPYGFFFFTSSIETIFISTQKPFRHFLSQIYPIKGQNWEGLAYVGITSLFCLFYLLFIAIQKRNLIRTYFKDHKGARIYLYLSISAFLLLLFSMGYPFKLGLQWLVDYIPGLQQFRAPGRFAWVFYFVTTIGVSVVISNYFLLRANKKLKIVISCILLLLFFVEGFTFHKEFRKRPLTKNVFERKYVDEELNELISIINEKKPQAIIPLPFFHIGSEYYNIEGTEKIISTSFITSYHSRTPLMAGLTGRTSLTESENLIQIISNDLFKKELKTKIHSTKPFFILYSKEVLNEEEENLLKKGKTILESVNYVLKEISPNELFANSAPVKWNQFCEQRSLLTPRNGFLLANDSYFYFEDFDSLVQNRFEGNARDYNLLTEFLPGTLQKDKIYEVSFWYQTRDRLDLDNILKIKEINSGSDTLVLATKNIKAMTDVQNQKVLATLLFKVEHPENRVMIDLNGLSDREKVFYIDDLMIREKSCVVYKVYYSTTLKDSVLKINNIDVPFKSGLQSMSNN